MKKFFIATGVVLASLLAQVQPAQALEPSFDIKESADGDSVNLRFGKNLLLAGNKIEGQAEAKDGLMITAGNMLNLDTDSEYGFVFGNFVKFAGATERDLYIAGNFVTLENTAAVGRDVYAAANAVEVLTDLPGDLTVGASEVILKDVKIDGNVNLDVEKITIEGQVEIAGQFNYNSTAETSGLEHVQAAETSVYEQVEVDGMAAFVAAFYAKVLSMVGLFLAMALICAFVRGLHAKVAAETSASRFGTDSAIGVGVLIGVPIAALISFCTLVAAPVGVIGIVLYCVMIYLAQGFSGMWLGHIIIEKLFKAKGNVYAETALGIFVLGLLSLVPYVGVATGFLGLVFGLGLMVACVKPSQTEKVKVVEAVEIAD